MHGADYGSLVQGHGAFLCWYTAASRTMCPNLTEPHRRKGCGSGADGEKKDRAGEGGMGDERVKEKRKKGREGKGRKRPGAAPTFERERGEHKKRENE